MFNQFEDRGQLANVLQRRLNMTGAAPAPSVAPELFPSFVYENDRIEWGYLKNEIPYARCRVTNTPGAGFHACVVLENPPISGSICVVTSVFANGIARVSLIAGTIGGIVAGDQAFPRDGRTQARSRSFVSEHAVATANLPALQGFMAANTEQNNQWVVTPGSSLVVSAAAAAASLTAHILFTERPAVQGELG